MNEVLVRKYAYTLARVGMNVQKGQYVLIESKIENYEFANLLAEECYKLGAKKVHIMYRDLVLKKLEASYLSKEEVSETLKYEEDEINYYMDKGACTIRLESEDPKLLEELDGSYAHAIFSYIDNLRNVMRKKSREYHKQWCIAIVPTKRWADVVLANYPESERLDRFWEVLFKLSLVDLESDPVKNWENHNIKNHNRANIIDDFDLDKLHFVSKNGTDLYVGLTPNSKFGYKGSLPKDYISFAANLPSEEICTSPDKFRVDGHVVTTKPLVLGGKVIKKFELTFKDGHVVDFKSPDKEEEQLLEETLNTDEGSSYLGEVALVEYHSPISMSGLIYYTTLIDENASCHLALGRCLGGSYIDEEGVNHFNDSKIHIDFMFGAPDMDVYGIKKDGSVVQIFKNGDFVF